MIHLLTGLKSRHLRASVPVLRTYRINIVNGPGPHGPGYYLSALRA